MNDNTLYALDFDGVICDSAVETAITGWKAARQIWPDMSGEVPKDLIERFRQVRPIIETGYEAILAMRLLFLGETVEAIFGDYANQTQGLLLQSQITVEQLKTLFGETRDLWIENDLADWVQMNPLFPGVADKLRWLVDCDWYIVTTKQERFVKQILLANHIELSDERIFGLDRNMSKADVLKMLLIEHPQQAIQFVEDRLPTLVNVGKHAELTGVSLIFALWGYNTTSDKTAAADYGFALQSLDSFLAGERQDEAV